jgi:hypothetical protein
VLLHLTEVTSCDETVNYVTETIPRVARRVCLTHTEERVFGSDGQELIMLTVSFLLILPCERYISIPPCSPFVMTWHCVERFILSTVDKATKNNQLNWA